MIPRVAVLVSRFPPVYFIVYGGPSCPRVRGAFENVTGCRTSIGLQVSRDREIWAGPQLLPRGIVEDIRFSEPAAIFHGTKLVRG